MQDISDLRRGKVQLKDKGYDQRRTTPHVGFPGLFCSVHLVTPWPVLSSLDPHSAR